VGSCHGIKLICVHQMAKPGVTQAAGSFFDGFALSGGFGRNIDLVGVDGNAERGSQLSGKLPVSVGFRAAQAMVQVGSLNNDSQFRRTGGKCPGERDRVSSA
jgi:hypothetical protein